MCRQFAILILAMVYGVAVSAEEPLRVAEVKKSIVRIKAHSITGEELGFGAGFVVAPNGVVATNVHVLEGGRRFSVETSDGTFLTVTGIWCFDRDHDIAIVQLSDKEQKGNLPVLKLAKDEAIVEGLGMYAIGHPRGLNYTISRGIISSTDRTMMDVNPVLPATDILQTDAATAPGSSGCPWVNEAGEVLAIHVMGHKDTELFKFGSHVKYVRRLIEKDRKKQLDAGMFSKGNTNWVTLFPLKPMVDEPFPNLKELQFTGHTKYRGGDEGAYSVNGQFVMDGARYKLQGGERAAITLLSDVRSFELDGMVDIGDLGGMFILIGWKDDSGILFRHILHRTSVVWETSKIQDGKLVVGTDVSHNKVFKGGGLQKFRLRMKDDKLLLSIGKQEVIANHPIEGYQGGDVILGTFPSVYGPKNVAIESLKGRQF